MTKAMKKVLILATGGTIAATGRSPEDNTHYSYGDLMVDSLLASLPDLSAQVELSAEDFCQIGSENMRFEIWLDLAAQIQARLQIFDAVVVTHGTDTMEETAFFLNLVLKTEKPVILTGAMRPASSSSADGPGNLADAVQVAVCDQAAGLGVLCVLGGEIWSAEAVRKSNVGSLQAFSGGDQPALGFVKSGQVLIGHQPSLPHTTALPFELQAIKSLPPVDLVYACAGMQTPKLNGPTVVAGFGLGTLPEWIVPELLATDQPLVLCGQSDKGRVVELYPGLPVVNLTPRKARVLLAVALAQAWQPEKIAASLALFA